VTTEGEMMNVRVMTVIQRRGEVVNWLNHRSGGDAAGHHHLKSMSVFSVRKKIDKESTISAT